MKIIKVKMEDTHNFQAHHDYILALISTDYNYYVVNEDTGYEEVHEIPINKEYSWSYDLVMTQITNASNDKIKDEIFSLKSELYNSDFKIIKSYEYSLVDKPLPYDVEALHTERQALRDKIDKLEKQIKKNKTWEELDNIIFKPNNKL